MAKYGCFRVWQATQFIHSYKVDKFADAIAYAFVDALVPLHITHCRQEVAESFDRTEFADAILRSLLNADKASNRRLNVTIASRLTAPTSGRILECCRTKGVYACFYLYRLELS